MKVYSEKLYFHICPLHFIISFAIFKVLFNYSSFSFLNFFLGSAEV
jgi:hypothetical protein